MLQLKKYYNKKIKSEQSPEFKELPEKLILQMKNSLGFALWNFHLACNNFGKTILNNFK